jgi:uncharacterized protein (TIGR03435 family)
MARQSWSALTLFIAALGAVRVLCQEPKFEVASVKRQFQTFSTSAPQLPLDKFYRRSETASRLISYAYGVVASQVVGSPDWIRLYGYEVEATAPGNASDKKVRLMVRTLLAERFKLVAHTEQREMRFAALTIARPDGSLGSQIQRCDPQQPPPPIETRDQRG